MIVLLWGFANKNTSLHLFGLPSRTLNIRLQIEAKISTWKLGQMISFHLICTLWILSLTHWDRDKMASIFQITFSNTFSWMKKIYRKTSNISRTKSQILNVSCILVQLSSRNPLKPDVKLRMKIWLEQRRQAMLQLHLSYQQFYCLLRCDLYKGFYGIFQFKFHWSLFLFPIGPIDNIPALVQIMVWRRPGDKPLSAAMMAWFTDAYMCHSASMS